MARSRSVEKSVPVSISLPRASVCIPGRGRHTTRKGNGKRAHWACLLGSLEPWDATPIPLDAHQGSGCGW